MTTGGRSQGVYVVTDAELASGAFRLRPGPALNVVGLQAATRGVMGGNAIPVYIVTDPSAGGVEGGEPMPVSNLTGIRSPIYDLAIPVYVVEDDEQFTSPLPTMLDGITNIKGIWSRRNYLSSYTGQAIRVVRASDSMEEDIGFVDNSIDMEEYDDFVEGTSGKIVSVYDSAGNGFTVTQSTDSKRPSLVASVLNSHPGFLFVKANQQWWNNAALIQAQPYLVIAVIRKIQNDRGVITDSNAAVQSAFYFGDGLTTNEPLRMNAGGTLFNGGPIAMNQGMIVSALFDSPTCSIWANGVLLAGNGNCGTFGLSGLRIGTLRNNILNNLYSFDGYMTDVIIVSGEHDAEKNNAIGSLLAREYDLSWSEVS